MACISAVVADMLNLLSSSCTSNLDKSTAEYVTVFVVFGDFAHVVGCYDWLDACA